MAYDLNTLLDQPYGITAPKEAEITKEVEKSKSSEHPQQLYYEPRDIGDIEDVEEYRPGGLHPVDMFDTLLDDRFEVCHKLGSGGMATVWLCYEKAVKKWKAIKINTADRSNEDSPEIRVSKVLQKSGDTSQLLQDYHIAMPLETFWIEGPNGKHLCTVLPVMGPRLSEWRHMSLGTDATRINNVCHQFTKGLDYLHSHGICHGDFRPENILMQLKGNGLDDLEPEQLFDLLHYPDKDEVLTLEDEHSPHAPKWVVDPLWWSELKDYISDDIAIVDFGEAFEESQPPKSLGIPRVYAAPEVIYGGVPAGIGSDLWSLAYTIMATRYGDSLCLDANLCGPLRCMERFAGPIPPPYRRAAAEEFHEQEMRLFKQHGENPEIEKPASLSEMMGADGENLKKLTWEASGLSCVQEIEDELRKELWEQVLVPNEGGEDGKEEKWQSVHYRLPEDEISLLADLLSQLFKYQPCQRSSAADILKHAWFKKRPEPIPEITETGESRPAINESESVPAKTRRPWWSRLWRSVYRLVPTNITQLSRYLQFSAPLVLFIGVTSFFAPPYAKR
ncbi:kinase-like domain-containing protein [Xylaria cubensis]|nr:kinase-like domain-containing protein [Xylaria cubensis]